MATQLRNKYALTNEQNIFLAVSAVMIAIIAVLVGCSEDSSLSIYGGEGLLDSWAWHNDNEIVLTFDEDGTGYWGGGVGAFEWGINRRDQLIVHAPGNAREQSRWEFETVELAIATLLIIERQDGNSNAMFLYISTDDMERTVQLLETMEANGIDPRRVAEFDAN